LYWSWDLVCFGNAEGILLGEFGGDNLKNLVSGRGKNIDNKLTIKECADLIHLAKNGV